MAKRQGTNYYNNRRARGKGTSPNARLNMVTTRGLHVALYGTAIKSRADPPTYTPTPWNSAVIYQSSTVDQAGEFATRITTSNVGASIHNQLGLPTGGTLQIRVKRVRGWLMDVSGHTTSALRLNAYDLVNTSTGGTDKVLQSIEDLPGRNHYANVGYSWPDTHSNVVITPDSSRVLAVFDFRNSAALKIYWDVLWRFVPPEEVPMTTIPVQ